jgi:hypothetical protein
MMEWLLSTQLLFSSGNCRSIEGIRANQAVIRLAAVYDSAATICANPFIAYIKVNAPPPGVLAYVFGTGIFH